MADQLRWHLSGDYFENCSCSVVCPCLVSKAAPLTSKPTEGVCNVPLVFHIEKGRYDGIALDGLNVVLAIQTPGKETGPSLPISTSELTTSRLKPWVPSSPVVRAGQWRRARRSSAR